MKRSVGVWCVGVLSALSVGCSAPSQPTVTVKGTGFNFTNWFVETSMGTSPATALTNSLWNGAKASHNLGAAATEVSNTAAGADGAFTMVFKAAAGTKFRVYVKGGTGIVPTMVQEEQTVPAADGTIDLGYIFGDAVALQEGMAGALGQTYDQILAQGTSMNCGTEVYTGFPEGFKTAGNLSVAVDNGFTSVDCCAANGPAESTMSAAGCWGITKKGNTAPTDVKVTMTDNSTMSPRPFTYDPYTLHIEPGYSTYHWPKHK